MMDEVKPLFFKHLCKFVLLTVCFVFFKCVLIYQIICLDFWICYFGDNFFYRLC